MPFANRVDFGRLPTPNWRSGFADRLKLIYRCGGSDGIAVSGAPSSRLMPVSKHSPVEVGQNFIPAGRSK